MDSETPAAEPKTGDQQISDSGDLLGKERTDRMPKSERKVLKFQRKISHMKALRQKRKAEQKLRREDLTKVLDSVSATAELNATAGESLTQHVSKHVKLAEIKDRLRSALEVGQKVCIDLGMEKLMSRKECSRLAQQLGRVYGANRKADRPFHVYLAGVDKSSYLFQECVRKNSGFEHYLIDFVEKSVFEHFDKTSVVYLSPDANDVLQTVERDKVYVIGGLVDETRQKNVTQNQASEAGVRTVRLPIDKFCEKSSEGTFSQVLSINQVFEILLHVSATGNWEEAFASCLPKRLGFRPKVDAELQNVSDLALPSN